MKRSKEIRRKKVRIGVRRKIEGTPDRPRLCVFRSNRDIYCQVIDDRSSVTLAAASTRDKGVSIEGNKSEQAKQVGKMIADRLKSRNINKVVFDRSGYMYHGRVKALAEGAREGGLEF